MSEKEWMGCWGIMGVWGCKSGVWGERGFGMVFMVV